MLAKLQNALLTWRTEVLIFVLVTFAGGYFFNGWNWNQVSRYDAIFAAVEEGTPNRGTMRIDHFLLDHRAGINTGDWAQNPDHDHHFYANKAPGPMLLGIPVYRVLYGLERLWDKDPRLPFWTAVNGVLLNLVLTVLPLAAAAVAAYRILRRLLGARDRAGALWLTAALVFGTMMLPYSTMLWGHVSAAAWVTVGMALVPGDAAWRRLAAGLCLGLAVLHEYSCAITVVCLAGWLLARRDWKGLALYGVGGLLPAAVHLGYHALCFGVPWSLATWFNNPGFRGGTQEAGAGLFQAIRLEPLWGITFSPYRGLFWTMPVLLLVLPAIAMVPRRDRGFYAVCIANLGLFLLMNLTFSGWHGGACVGPRYLIPALPGAVFLIAGLRRRHRLWPVRTRRRTTIAATALLAVSAAYMLVLCAVTPLAPAVQRAQWRNPVWHYARTLVAGRVPPIYSTPLRVGGFWRIGGRPDDIRHAPYGWATADVHTYLAECVLHPVQAQEVTLHFGYRLGLVIELGGQRAVLPDHGGQFQWATQRAMMPAAAVPLTVRTCASAMRKGVDPRFRFYALAADGSVILPQVRPDDSIRGLRTFNLGTLAGLGLRWSLVPWLVVVAGLGVVTWRTRVPAPPTREKL